MFGTIRKHQQWLWAVIITLTIISFVIFFSPYSKMNDGAGGRGNFGTINGEKVTAEDYGRAQREVYLRYFLFNGRWPDEGKTSNFDAMRETYQWLLLIQKQQQMGIHVSSDLAAQTAGELLRPFQRMGMTSPKQFIEQVLQPRGFATEDFERFARHYLGLQELMSTVALSGKLVTPQEARSLYERENQEVSTEAVLFNGSNYLARVTVTPEAVAQFYSNRVAIYRIPDRVQVSYVKFNVTNYLADAEAELNRSNLTQIVEDNYQRLGTNAATYHDAKSPEEARANIRRDIIRFRAMTEARRKAGTFAEMLFSLEPVKLDNLQKLAQSNNLPVQVSAPFDRDQGPKDLAVGADFVKQAFSRTDVEPFTEPIPAEDGVYVIGLNKKIPSEIPSLDQIRDKVTADCRWSRASELARQEGTAFQTALANGLAQNKSFTTICTEAKVNPVMLPPLALSTRTLTGDIEEHVSLNLLKQLAFTTQPGKASDFTPTSEGGVLLFVRAKLPLDEAKMKSELPEFVKYVRQARLNEAFNDWFRREAERGFRNTPLNEVKPGAIGSTAKS